MTLTSFEELKKVMTQAPVLVLPNFTQPFEIECDTLGVRIGAVLMQNVDLLLTSARLYHQII